ncbi:MAG: hypothetical protein LH645_05935 [Actinomycetia bacterium]|nr:hypothetical protein [Actinomycetes bacterium]
MLTGSRLAAVALLATFAISMAGCTNSKESSESAPASSSPSGAVTTSRPSDDVDPTPSGEPTGGAAALTQAVAQAALDDALAAVDNEGSISFTSQGENVIDDDVTKISGSGAWTRKPLAWATTTTIDRPKSAVATGNGVDQTTELIYVESTPTGPYVRTTFAAVKKIGFTGSNGRWWMRVPGYGVGDGVTWKDISTPLDLRMLVQTDASAGSAIGDTLTISGTIPSSSALVALDLTDHLGGLGFANRFEDSSTRVLVTIGADGLPQTLQFTGTNISLPGVGLPEYVAKELAGARYLVEYGDANLKGPIKAPDQSVPSKALTP